MDFSETGSWHKPQPCKPLLEELVTDTRRAGALEMDNLFLGALASLKLKSLYQVEEFGFRVDEFRGEDLSRLFN